MLLTTFFVKLCVFLIEKVLIVIDVKLETLEFNHIVICRNFKDLKFRFYAETSLIKLVGMPILTIPSILYGLVQHQFLFNVAKFSRVACKMDLILD